MTWIMTIRLIVINKARYKTGFFVFWAKHM